MNKIYNYPLYDVLKKESCKYSDADKKKMRAVFLKSLEKMTQQEFDTIFILIKIHAKILGKHDMIPFDGCRDDKGDATFNFNKFPILLQRILMTFSIKHNQNIKESENN